MLSLALFLLLLSAADTPPAGGENPEPLERRVTQEPPVLSDPLPISAEAICARARHDMESGGERSLDQARKLYEAVVKWYPAESCGHAGLSRALGSIYRRMMDQDDALIDRSLESARRAVELDPESATAQAALAAAMLMALSPEEALARADAAVRLDPASVPALQTAAVVRMATGDVTAARQAIDEATRLRPDLPENYHISGNVHIMAGDEGLALKDYNIALALDPDSVPTTLQLASALEQIGNLTAAAKLFDRVIEEHPDDAGRAYFIMGHSLMKRHSWNAALNAFERASFETRKGFGTGTILYLQAICYEQLGRTEEAQAAFRQVIDEYPDATAGYVSPDRLAFPAYEALSRISLALDRNDDAVDVLEEGVSVPGASLDLFIRLARLYEDYSLPARAAGVLEKAVDRDISRRWAGRQMAAYVLWARVAARDGDREALGRLVGSLRARSGQLDEIGDYVLYIDAVRALCLAGRADLALESLRKAVAAGYDRLDWMTKDPEMAPVTRSEGFDALLTEAEGKASSD